MKPEIKVGQEHKWRRTLGGSEMCIQRGCTVRRSSAGLSWQPKKGGRWRAISSLPLCFVDDAPPEARVEHTTAPCRDCGVSGGHHYAACEFYTSTQPAAPSPLEVVRKEVRARLKADVDACDWGGTPRGKCEANPGRQRCDCCIASDAMDALLATLEESIRADERARVGDELQRRGYPVAGGAVLAMKR